MVIAQKVDYTLDEALAHIQHGMGHAQRNPQIISSDAKISEGNILLTVKMASGTCAEAVVSIGENCDLVITITPQNADDAHIAEEYIRFQVGSIFIGAD